MTPDAAKTKSERSPQRADLDYAIASWQEVVQAPSQPIHTRSHDPALHKVIEQWHRTLDVIQDAICLVDMQKRIVICNQTMGTLLGTSIREIVGRNCCEVLHALSESVPECPFDKMRQTFQRESQEFHIGNRWVCITADPVLNEAGELVGAVHVISDITERKRMEQELRVSEERFRDLTHTLPQTVFETDAQGNLTFVNDSGLKMFGYTREDFNQGFHALDMIAPADQSRARKNITEMLTTKSDNLLGREYKALRKDGSTFDIIIYDSVILKQDRSQGLRGAIFDISDRKHLEDTLRQKEQRYRSTLESMADGIHVVDRNMRILIFNRTFQNWCQQLGLNIQPIGRNLFEVFDFLPEKVRQEYDQVWHTGNPLVTEENTQISEKMTYTETRKIPILEEDRVTHILTIVRDITERKMSEHTLQRSENLLRTIINATQEAMISIGQNGLIRLFNPAAEKMFQRSKESMIGRPLDELMPEKYRQRHRAYVKSYFYQGKPTGAIGRIMELPGLRANGEIFPMEISLSFGRIGPEQFVIAVARDISERRKAEEELQNYQHRLKSLASELSLAEERQRRQVATELHENIGQLLALIKIKLGMMQESAHTHLETDQLKEMRNLLEQTIAYTRNLTLNLSPPILYELGLKAALEWLVEQYQKQHNLIIEYCDNDDIIRMNDDLRGLLYQTVRELLVNVVKHAQAKYVHIRVRRTPQDIEVTVADDGRGFQSADGSEAKHFSKGFGLFNMRERFTHFGGRVNIQSQPDQGTKIILFAPLVTRES